MKKVVLGGLCGELRKSERAEMVETVEVSSPRKSLDNAFDDGLLDRLITDCCIW
jgi:hypothetical protein